jgi:hypothetical protein
MPRTGVSRPPDDHQGHDDGNAAGAGDDVEYLADMVFLL